MVMDTSWSKPSTHNMTHTALFSSTPFTPLPTFRNIPPITTLVPPDIGPDFGDTELTEEGSLTRTGGWGLDCAVISVMISF